MAEHFFGGSVWNQSIFGNKSPFKIARGGKLAIAFVKIELEIIPPVIPCGQLHSQGIALQQRQAAAVGHDQAAYHRLAAIADRPEKQAASQKKVDAAQIKNGQKATVVQMAVHIQIIGQDTQIKADFIREIDSWF